MRRTKMVFTLGPSSDSGEVIRSLIDAGMDVARMNMSHGAQEHHAKVFHMVRDEAARSGRNVAIMLDLQGPKIRTGRLVGKKAVMLESGVEVTITTDDIEGTATLLSTTYARLPYDVRPDDRILMADGNLELRVLEVAPPEVKCIVVIGGALGEHKGINLPGVPVSAPSMTPKDIDDLRFGLDLGVDYVALSFVRTADDVQAIKDVIAAAKSNAKVVSKIERPEALSQIDKILRITDAVMVARGDLGVETPFDEVPQVQKNLITACNIAGIPVITATQMLESMMTAPRPTRAEANDVANAIYDGTDAVMLSGETAAGIFPVEAARVMARIAEKADAAVAGRGRERLRAAYHDDCDDDFSEAISRAVVQLTQTLKVNRVVCLTSSGYTALHVARFRPCVPITAFTLSEEARRRCALVWGVEAVASPAIANLDELTPLVDSYLLREGLAEKGETVVIVAGTPLLVPGRTNLLKLHAVGDVT